MVKTLLIIITVWLAPDPPYELVDHVVLVGTPSTSGAAWQWLIGWD